MFRLQWSYKTIKELNRKLEKIIKIKHVYIENYITNYKYRGNEDESIFKFGLVEIHIAINSVYFGQILRF